jgi:hypothetical protein
MEINRRLKIIIGVAILLLVIIILVLWFFLFRKQEEEVVTPTNQDTIQIPSGSLPAADPLPQALEDQDDGFAVLTELRAVAGTFAERFGSYSNESNFYNIDSSLDLMSDKMKTWANEYKASNQPASNQDPYYGISTKLVSVSVDDYDETLKVATVTVGTQRSEFRINTSNPRIFYQNLVLTFVQEGSKWKVDSATWVEVQ